MKHKVPPYGAGVSINLPTVRPWMSNTLLTLFNAAAYREYYRTGFWRNDTVYSLVAGHANRTPGRIAVRSLDHDVTYGELIALVDAFASDLARKGVIAGQR